MSPTITPEEPLVTVVVPTRDRGIRIARTIQSILELDYSRFVVRIVDQSEDDATEKVVEQFDHARVHYERSAGKGISAGLNCGIGGATSELVAMTGDDCDPATNWLKMLLSPFALDPRIGIVFGNVLPGPHDETLGFVPGYVRTGAVHANGIRDRHLIGGTSACMAVRRSVWQELGGFDEMLGVGAPLRAGEDVDLTTRALLGGYHVFETPTAEVVHRGFFPWEARAMVIRRNWYGTGAALAKSLRLGHASIVLCLARLAWRWISVGPSPVAASIGSKLVRGPILRAFAHGFLAGALTPLERSSGHYQERAV
ncbi:MAG TPA: glycosyltransferase family 2 protein [Gemmatimonadota bacterium]|nr:glycosyltransferase family 2 protein [Gemmatimonadota bacterium]